MAVVSIREGELPGIGASARLSQSAGSTGMGNLCSVVFYVDERERIRLLAALMSLMRDEEVLKMAEQLMPAADKELMLDTPFLRRIREEGRAEGQAEGLVKGLVESILDVMRTRLKLSAPTYRRLESQISTITDVDRLRDLLQVAVQATDVADFEQALEG